MMRLFKQFAWALFACLLGYAEVWMLFGGLR